MRICVPLGALFDDSVEALGRAGLDVAPLRDAGRRLVVEAADGDRAEALAAADGWRFVARRAGDGYTVVDRVTGERRAGVARLEEALPSPG